MILRTSILAMVCLASVLFASADAEGDREKQIRSKLNSIINKAGIHFNGTFRSQYLNSALNPDRSGDSAVDWEKKKMESNEYTSVDFDIGARPNDALSARCIFRMHQNWQNFFSDVSNPIFLRWISIDGNIKDMIRFNVGDYKQRYSPLTLWSPDIEIAYEPEIFAAKRREAMKEVFLGNNERALQGVNFNFDAEVVPVFNEFHFNVQANRLRLSETSIQSGSAVAATFDGDFDQDRYYVGVNLDAVFLKGIGFGGTVNDIFDLAATGNKKLELEKLDASHTVIAAFRLEPTTKTFLDSDVLEFGINLEVANSWDRDSAWYDSDSAFNTRNKTGLALDVGVKGDIKIGEHGAININAGFMNNDKTFRNELAQTPSFFGQRIMNIENDYSHNARLYTTFDALYDYVFKFTPSKNNKSDTVGVQWVKEPHRKISYNSAVLGPDEYDQVDSVFVRYDPALQTVLPFGPATPNRSGPKAGLKFTLFDGGIDIGGSFASLSEVEADSLSDKNKYFKMAGGLSIDIATWAKVLNCLKLSFGYQMDNMENGKVVTVDEAGNPVSSSIKSNNGFLNLGLYYNFWRRFSLLAGFQQIVNKMDVSGVENTTTQHHWALGLEYKVAENMKVIGRYGQIGAKFDDSAAPTTDLDFVIQQMEVFLTVDF